MRTFGRLDFEMNPQAGKPGLWRIDAEPHVIIRAKRVFAKAKQQVGRVILTDSADLCRDLAWFVERYPLEMSDADRARLTGSAAAHLERETLVAELIAGMRAARPFNLAIEPREYQRVAAELVLRTGGLLLADDVGIGKTCSAICALSDPGTRPALVVTLAHLTRQWEREIQKFAPALTTHVLRQRTPYDLTAPKKARPGQLTLPGNFPDVIITSYAKLSGWAETLAPLIRSVVWDEVQELRRGDASSKGEAAYRIAQSAQLRLGLSATPIYNYGSEIWSVIEAVAPNHLGSRSEFLTEWCGTADNHGRSLIKNAKAFGTYLRESGVMLRRTREEVGRELPEVVRVPHDVDTDDRPLKDIKNAAHELAGIILGEKERARGEKLRAAEELSSLVRHATGVAKAPYVAEFVKLLVESGESVVLYGWHRDVYDIWLDRLNEYRPVLYTGSESAAAKDKARTAFLSKETDVLIMSLRSGAGLDGLQDRCRTVVFGELDWSPGVHEQCTGRVHRDGQKGPVVAYYLIAEEGSDPLVADTLGVKRAQIEGIRNPNADLLEKLEVGGDRIKALAALYMKRRPRDMRAAVYSMAEARVAAQGPSVSSGSEGAL